MKTRQFGEVGISDSVARMHLMVSYQMFAYPHEAVDDYILARQNGTEADNPSTTFPEDGKYSVEKNRQSNGEYGYSVRYYAGPHDLEWMAEKDRNYQSRLARERLGEAATLKATTIENVVTHMGSVDTVNLSELIASTETQANHDAQASDWYTHPDLPVGITPFDFRLNVDDVERLVSAIRDNPAIKTINLSNMDLSGDLRPLMIKLFKARNDFTVINLASTHLTNESLDELLNALYDSRDTARRAPLIEKFNISDNQITSIHMLINFIYNCARAYYFQDHSTANDVPTLPLSKVNLRCNLIWLTENSDSVLRRCVEQLQERHETLRHLSIRLSGNIIQINVPNPFQEVRRDMWQYGFFITKHLQRRQSIMQPDKYLTPTDGFVYLVRVKKPEDAIIYFGHASIFTERLNVKGQLELRKLEFGLPAACGTSGAGGVNVEQIEALRLMHGRGKLDFQQWSVKDYRIQELIDNVERSCTTDAIKYSSLGIFGENCMTWAIDKLKGIELEVDMARFPAVATGASRVCSFLRHTFGLPLTEVPSGSSENNLVDLPKLDLGDGLFV